jgi:hypothetical protein
MTHDAMRCSLEFDGLYFYAPQTKIWEGGTKDEIPIFDRLFNGS